MTKKRRLSVLSLVLLAAPALGQELRDWAPDLDEIQRAMREEIFLRIEQKAEPEYQDKSLFFDFLTLRAYETIKGRIRTRKDKSVPVRTFLSQLYSEPPTDDSTRDFRNIVDEFALGMGIELRDTLQAEFDEAYDFLIQLIKFSHDLSNKKSLTRESLNHLLKQYGFPPSVLKRLTQPPLLPSPSDRNSPTFEALTLIKKAITGTPPDRNQHVMFILGDRYRDRYGFMQDFLEVFRHLWSENSQWVSKIRTGLRFHDLL